VDATESSQIRAMRRLQLSQTIKGLAADLPIEGDSPNRIEELLRELRRAKAYLWHGSPHRALRTLEDLTWDIGTETPRATALQDKLDEFMNYITANIAAIPNYADRHRHGEPIATGFVESAVNQVDFERWHPQLRRAADPESIRKCGVRVRIQRTSSKLPQ
jgi:hypothetical protein